MAATAGGMTTNDDWLRVGSLDLDGQGVARDASGKVVFIDGALPGECVRVRVVRRKPQWEQGTLEELREETPLRVQPRCPHFGLHAGACGGCRMQHFDPAAQVAVKQRVLEDTLRHVGKVQPERVLRPVEGTAWGYRTKARLSVRFVPKKGGMLVGFHERRSSYVADMRRCDVLPPQASALLMPLRELLGSMDARDRLPQVELAMGDSTLALVLRHLRPLSEADLGRLREFAAKHGVRWWLQPQGPDSAEPLDDGDAHLSYALPEFGLTIRFRPTDFTQVNPLLNRVLVSHAVRLLHPTPTDRVIDWFCGVGNFTLPIATRAREAVGIEGAATSLQRALEAAGSNGLAARTRFEQRNLFEMDLEQLMRLEPADLWLIDPPREGAIALVSALAAAVGDPALACGYTSPRRIVYISCNPATLARDAGVLVHLAGYRCSLAGVANMFPHTAHVESIVVFDAAKPNKSVLNPTTHAPC